ncbi:DUF397 domain-containing protein [Streptomyces griseoincarnatus]|uniref:DUF397 domain-containing protein n=1 Tax=Streptomyces griseoincarnatus TaxID=29305 RepID=A0ABT0VW77_STRGI|nr:MULTISPECIES: DUF397 domain-containing protein [Streptomyces]MBJ6613224.1 DUF397 domain-containing protein [Streptomyces sp. I3(2020)]MBJ6623812.1 DUF397 domain-containing protein [Streptomyces sp. I4(2020)]MCM2515507.1 DUF397 domain-containing protein [Streptomyces griseoincarnatus]
MSIEQVRALTWIKSSYSGTNGGDCVEVAARENSVYVRDSKAVDDGAPVLRTDRAQWAAFVTLVSAV